MSAIWWQADEIGQAGTSAGEDVAVCRVLGRGCRDRAGIATEAVSVIDEGHAVPYMQDR